MSQEKDTLIAPLRCSHCGVSSNASLEFEVRHVEQGDETRIGAPLRVEWEHLEPAGYFIFRTPSSGEPIRFVASWDCRQCERGWQWAEVVVAGDKIQSATAISLNRDDLERVHAIDGAVADYVDLHTSVDLFAMSDDERRAYLLEHPPSTIGD